MKRLTCRNCDREIYERNPSSPSPHNWMSRSWYSHGTSSGSSWEDDTDRRCPDGKVPEPKEICRYMKGDGGKCENPVRHEDVEAGHFACGVHMKRFLEDKEREDARLADERQRKETEELRQWELTLYQAAYDRLHALNPELFPDSNRPTMRWRHIDGDEVKVDVIKLERWLRENGMEAARDEADVVG